MKEGFAPPIPLQVLAEAKGRLYSPDELARKFSRALFPRTTNRYGCVTLQSYHFYIEEGVPHTQVLLWVYGEQPRAVLDHVVLAEYHLSLSRLNHGQPGVQAHPEIVQGTTELHHQVTDTPASTGASGLSQCDTA